MKRHFQWRTIRARFENDPNIYDHEILIPSVRNAYFSPSATHCVWKNSSFRAPAISENCRSQKVTLQHQQMLRLPRKVTLQHHEMLRLPQKVRLQHDQVLRLPRKVRCDVTCEM